RISAAPAPFKGPARLPYLALLQVGFTVPSRVATDAVRSYRTVSPLPVPRGTWAVCSLLHFPWAHAPQALPGTRSAGARTFLRSRHRWRRQRLPGRLSRATIRARALKSNALARGPTGEECGSHVADPCTGSGPTTVNPSACAASPMAASAVALSGPTPI